MPFTHGRDIGEMAARDGHTDIEVVDGGGAGKTGFVHPRMNSRAPHLLQEVLCRISNRGMDLLHTAGRRIFPFLFFIASALHREGDHSSGH